MKKLFKLWLVLLPLLILTACSTKATNSSNSSQTSVSSTSGTVKLVVKDEDDTIMDETVAFEEGDTVMDVLEEHCDVEAEDGFITSINDIEQDADKGLYWMFDVNGELGSKAADQLEVNDGDNIEFYQEVYDN